MQRRSSAWRRIVPALACTLALGAVARADGPTPARGGTEPSGMRYNVDPQTGTFLPTLPDAPAARARTAEEPMPAPIPAPGGGMMIVVPESHTHAFVGTLDAAGRPQGRCDAPPSAATVR